MSRRMKVLGILVGIGTMGFAATVVLLLIRGTGVEILDIWVHRLDNAGRVTENWNVIGPHRVKPLAMSTWTYAEWNAGNIRIDVRFRNDLGHASKFRFDTQTLGRKTRQVGERVSTRSDLIQPGAEHVHMHWIRMWAEDIMQKCWIVESDTGKELAYLSFELNKDSRARRAPYDLISIKIN